MPMKEQIDAVLGRATAKGDVPGVVAMVTDRERTLYEGAFGQRALGQDAPMRTDSVGLIASMTKAITSTAAMQLVEQNRLDLDNPASTWLPCCLSCGSWEPQSALSRWRCSIAAA